MKKVIIALFFVSAALTVFLGGYYLYATGKFDRIPFLLSSEDISVLSRDKNIKVNLEDPELFRARLVEYDVLGEEKSLKLPSSEDAVKGDVKSVRVVFTPTGPNFIEVLNSNNHSEVAYSYYPEHKDQELILKMYVNPNWLKQYSADEQEVELLKGVVRSLYYVTHKITWGNISEVKDKVAGIHESITADNSAEIWSLVIK